MSALDREIAQTLAEIKNALTLSATAMRELKYTRVVDAGTRLIGPDGTVELSNFSVPYAAIAAYSQSSQAITIHNQPRGVKPTQGQGVAELGPAGFGLFNMAGRAVTFYGNPGDAVTYTIFAQAQPPNAAAGALSVTGTATVAGTVTAQTPATADIYSEASTSRTTSGTTATLTWPANVAAAFVGINITAFAGGTNVTISLQQQDANGVWQTLASSAALTATGPADVSAGPGTANGVVLRSGGSYRLAWTVTGTFTTLTFQLGVTAR